jgi:hypothetical protein
VPGRGKEWEGGRRVGMGTCSGAAKRGSDLPGLKSVFCRKKKKMMMKCFKKKMG